MSKKLVISQRQMHFFADFFAAEVFRLAGVRELI